MEQENGISVYDLEDDRQNVSEEDNEVNDEIDEVNDVNAGDEPMGGIDGLDEDIEIQGVEETKNQDNDEINNGYDDESDYSIEVSDDDTSEDEDEDEYEDDNLDHKFDYSGKSEYIKTTHPHILKDTYNDINVLSNAERDADNNIVDENHTTIPILSKYEKTRVLGIRISQLNNGAIPYVNIENTIIIDNNIIAEKELLEKKIPIIVMRPLPNGKKEYWKLTDLEIITY
jgi:DNA-directed RNA polymerase I, II, and III subunit RPABC2|tara:strand:- start:3618 stop:4304 length:687 start_codon:yes stop_codon:yes gene_type:complete